MRRIALTADTIARMAPVRRHRRIRAGHPVIFVAVPMYAMLSTLGPDGWETLRQHPERILAVRGEVEALGLKVHAQYALMGQYDFLNLIEAPDEETMAKAAIMLAARGTMRTTTLPAIPIEQLITRLQADA
jgi:uncharacterized protein with GYD domain